LAGDVALAKVPLRVQGVEALVQSLMGRLPGVNGTTLDSRLLGLRPEIRDGRRLSCRDGWRGCRGVAVHSEAPEPAVFSAVEVRTVRGAVFVASLAGPPAAGLQAHGQCAVVVPA
jgi:hypothetical protein